jgi:hypothetical protein
LWEPEPLTSCRFTVAMFDHYHPCPSLKCPACCKGPYDWKGSDGPGRYLVRVQGRAAPVDQKEHDNSKLTPELREEFRLPARFAIQCACRCPSLLEAVGWTENGVWTRTELLNAANAEPGPFEGKDEFRKRVAALKRHSGHSS